MRLRTPRGNSDFPGINSALSLCFHVKKMLTRTVFLWAMKHPSKYEGTILNKSNLHICSFLSKGILKLYVRQGCKILTEQQALKRRETSFQSSELQWVKRFWTTAMFRLSSLGGCGVGWWCFNHLKITKSADAQAPYIKWQNIYI